MRIGVTERGDPSLDWTWIDKMDQVDAAILITKNLSDELIQKAKPYFGKLKFHITCTGYGGTCVEPHIPNMLHQLSQTKKLVEEGMPKERIIIRVDPIIPTSLGIRRAATVIYTFAKAGFRKFRVSLIDMYPHVRERFRKADLPLPFGEKFAPSAEQLAETDRCLAEIRRKYPDIVFESCAEPGLREAEAVGCITAADANDFGLGLEANIHDAGYQRKYCLCCSAKTELLSQKSQCPYKCLYCYWKNPE